MSLAQTALYDAHVELGAKMAPFAGFDMPLQYSSVKEETLAVRNSAGVFDVSHMGEFFVEGPDATAFVDFMITNDFANAEKGKAVYSPLCREDGTVIDDLICYKLSADKILVCVNAANIEKDWQWFKKQVSSFNCKLTNESQNYSLLALQGPQSEKILEKISLLSKDKDFSYYSVKEISCDEHKYIIARTGYTGEDGFEIFASHSAIKALWSKLLENGATPCGLAARDILRLEVCYPLYGHEIYDDVTPLDSGLKWTVKSQKNNFIGKDALESYSAKYKLIKLSLEKGIPREGYPILNSNLEQIGQVTSGTMSVTLGKGIALGHVKANLFPDDKKFFIAVRKNHFEANYHTKAFVTGGHK